jgi:signal transduction histidine kinase
VTRLYLRFYAALLVSLVVFAVATTVVMHRSGGPIAQAGMTLGRLVQNALPPADLPAAQQQVALEKLVEGLNADITLLAADGTRLATIGKPLSLRGHAADEPDRPAWVMHLKDGRLLLLSNAPINFRYPAHILLLMLLTMALVVGVAAYPVIRRMGKRLERLQAGVESLGSGDLSARVEVEGRDEVARLAESFNRAASRIEELVAARKALLANASHELRTPLTRIRLAIELMKESADPKRKARLEQDIAELDLLIDEILLASRLDVVTERSEEGEVDLLPLAAEECARYEDVALNGVAITVKGDSRLLRRMLRNLLENAARHGAPPVEVWLNPIADGVEIVVEDGGTGVRAEDFERIFEPFYRRNHASGYVGTGLGLALVRQIARHHGGDVRCARTSAGRNSFVVTLPIR